MRFDEWLQIYFERSNALQWYWTLYVVVIGGLLAFSSLRKRPDLITAILVTVLFIGFAYKNLGAIGEVTYQRFAVFTILQEMSRTDVAGPMAGQAHYWPRIQPTLNPPAWADVRNFHVICDALTILAVWAMEWRRRYRWRKIS